jgi:hypothetical protein
MKPFHSYRFYRTGIREAWPLGYSQLGMPSKHRQHGLEQSPSRCRRTEYLGRLSAQYSKPRLVVHTSVGQYEGLTRSWMRTHDAKDIIVIFDQGRKHCSCESLFAVVFVNDELIDPANLAACVLPSGSKRISSQNAIDGHTDVCAV